MNTLLGISFGLNLIIIVCEIWTLSKIKKKINIIKYYTFLQNFLALIISIIFTVYLIVAIFFNVTIPQFIRGIRYVATCGLIATMCIYTVFLSSKNKLEGKDFISNFNPRIANVILHYFCPIISLASFVLFEKTISLDDSRWTGYVAIPSCIYWIIYMIFSIFNIWEEPYDFSFSERKNNKLLIELVMIISIPLCFILISYVLWNVR